MGNLVSQGNDVLVMLAAGQNPFQLAIQQGTQITQVIGPLGAAGAFRALRGAVLSMGVFIGASTKIVDRVTGEVHIGRVPAYSVVVPGSLPGKPLADGSPGPSLYCAVIIKQVDEKTRAKTSVNDLLRD